MKRLYVQITSFIVTNLHLTGFINGTIFKGKTKHVCVPGLNCYSCPGAIGSCPIGALQAVLGSAKQKISYYVLGLLIFFGATMGRWICGFLCPFGLLQDLIYKIKTKKIAVQKKYQFLKYTKYLILLVMVILLPMIIVNEYGNGAPFFCAYLCPSGTFFGAIPLMLLNPSMRDLVGFQFFYKLSILIAILIASIFIYRFFCKFLCPLGAFYGLFNKISLVKFSVDEEKCTSCGACKKACKMDIDPKITPNNSECIRCMDCIKSCKFDALYRNKLINPNK